MINRYKINSIEDFFKVPADRMQPMLEDFAQFLHLGHSLADNPLLGLNKNRFEWIDDGETGLSEIEITGVAQIPNTTTRGETWNDRSCQSS